MKQAINFRKARSALVKNGYSLDRIRGSHYMYKKEGRTVVINLKLNDCVGYLKEFVDFPECMREDSSKSWK